MRQQTRLRRRLVAILLLRSEHGCEEGSRHDHRKAVRAGNETESAWRKAADGAKVHVSGCLGASAG